MFNNIIKSAFDIKSIISVFLIGMQRAIFITESGIGTSAISSSVVENNEEALYQGIKKLLDNPELLKHYKKKAKERGKMFSTEKTVNAVQNMLLSL